MKHINETEHVNKVTTASLLVALGIIYGDLGTSPLYTLRGVVIGRELNEILLLGSVSLIFWTLTFQTTFKYIILTLMADNDGEGGIFSLYALVRRYGKKLVFITIIGATALLADGIITPPISVASAIEGLTIIKGLEHIHTVPIVIIILTLLFLFQRFGTQKIGKAFGPIMTIWFLMIFIVGVVSIIQYPAVIKALNPYYGYLLLTKYPHGFWLLGSIFLCATGAEALYSDLGHCGIKNIRITWIYVKISLVASYLGQAAWLLKQNSLEDKFLTDINPFFQMMPSWFLFPSIIIATVATIIASQALISGAFTLISEGMSLNFWPRVTIKQTSNFKGQIYIPSINIILWAGCIFMVIYFKTSTHMEAAFGFSVNIAMLMTTILLFYFLRFKKKWGLALTYAIIGIFIFIEISFLIVNVIKIEQRWVFLFFDLSFLITMYVCYYARKINNQFMKSVNLNNYVDKIKELSHDESIPKIATHLIYLSKAKVETQVEDAVINSIFDKKPKRADVYWFMHIRRADEPYTLSYKVIEISDDKVIKVTIKIGFRIQPRTEMFFKRIVQDLVLNKELNLHIRPDGSTKYNPNPDFKFIIIEKFLSVENEFSIRNAFLLESYFLINRFSLSDEKAFGLDISDVIIEQVPLIYQPVTSYSLQREY